MIKRIFAILLILVLLSGCGAPAEKKDAVSPASASSTSSSGKQAKTGLITEDEVKELLMSRKIDCRYRSSSDARDEDGIDSEFNIVEITGLKYSTGTQNEAGTLFEVNGTFEALGSLDVFKSNPPFYPNFTTVEPFSFNMTVARNVLGKVSVSSLKIPNPPLAKPANSVDLDNLALCLDKETDWTIIFAPADGGPLDTPVGKVDVLSSNLRIVVLEDLYPDEALTMREYKVEVFDGDEYLCTGYLRIDYEKKEPSANFISHPDKLRKLR